MNEEPLDGNHLLAAHVLDYYRVIHLENDMRDSIQKVLYSVPHKEWEKKHPVDANKIWSEWNGTRRPTAGSAYAQGLIELIRLTVPRGPTAFDNLFPCAMYVNSEYESEVKTFKSLGGKSVLLNTQTTEIDVLWAAKTEGMPYGMWYHCRSENDIRQLLAEAFFESDPLVGINVEQELETTLTPPVIRKLIDESKYIGQVIIIAYGWVQNNVRVTDADLGLYPWLLEMFPQDAPELMPPYEKWQQCKIHAQQAGIKYPYQLAGVYGAAEPSWYTPPYSVYPADQVTDWRRWT